jgi:Arc/MetJ family transcription regulator
MMHIQICINEYNIMRTTLDLPEKLMEEAMKATGATTKSQLIKDALQAEINSAKRKRLITKKGTVDLGIDLDTLRDRNK